MSNTTQLSDGKYVVTSSVSLAGTSRTTLAAEDVVATSTLSVGGAVTLSATSLTASAVLVGSGAAIGPTVAFSSEASLGLFRSGASTLAVSYGTLRAPAFAFGSEQSLGLIRSVASTIAPSYGTFDLASANIAFSSGTTAQSAATAKVGQGQMIFSILSLTTNGAALYFRSGNSTYVWPSSGVIG